jgi:BirA family transcriptional regulator, biotin operon repressor / biotin---[acetyl-CoA-carboxylase] ligase
LQAPRPILSSDLIVTLLSSGARLLHFREVDSTNAEAQRQALAGERGPLWVVADRQTQGRGRHGRLWVSEEGNLFATLLVTLAVAPAVAAQLSFVASLAAADAIRPLVPEKSGRDLSLKWPNDVLIGGRKVAGILPESLSPSANEEAAVAIGCGLNVAHVPAGTRYPATCLADEGSAATREEVFSCLAAAMAAQLTAWSAGEGFDVIRQCWLAQAAGLGGRAAVELGHDRLEGTFINIAADGALILRLDDGEQRSIHGGEVKLASIERWRTPTQ